MKIILIFLCFSIFILAGNTLDNKELLGTTALKMQNYGALIIDVRTSEEFQLSHVDNSILIPAWILINGQRQWSNLFVPIIERLRIKYPKQAFIFICKSGNRSKFVVGILEMNNINNIYHIHHGYSTSKYNDDWVDLGLPTK